MVPHSLRELWRHPPSETKGPRPGKPEIKWTESQERQLFRLITQANVPFKSIDVAIYEPGKPGKPEFKPSVGTCRNHWEKMTDMKPSDMRIKNKISLMRHREQLKRAFEAYLERQSKLSSDLGTEDRISSEIPQRPGVGSEHPTSTPTGLAGSASNVDTPPLTFEGTTPIDSTQAIPTPEPHEAIQQPFANEDARLLDITTSIREGDKNVDLSSNIPSTGTKRHAPPEFDDGSASSRYHSVAESSSQEQDILSNGIPSEQSFPVRDSKSRARIANSLPCVEEEPSEIKSNVSKATSKIRTISALEGNMGVPPGFIGFVKYGLTKSRWSIQSAISRVSRQKSSSSLLIEPDTYEESKPLTHEQHMPSSVPPHAQSTTTQPIEPTQLYLGPQRTTLFLELQLAGATDQEIAARLHDLLKQYGERAQQIVETRGPGGEIPLEVALKLGNIPACKVLMNFGANVKAKTSDGSSLREFGAKVLKNTNTSQQYYAIGACRNAIREGRNNETPLNDASRKRAKLEKTGSKTILPGEGKSPMVNEYPEQSNLPYMFPIWPSSNGQESLSSDIISNTDQSPQEHVYLPSQQSDTSHSQHGSPQNTPRPAVAELVRHFNQGAQPPSSQGLRRHSLSGVASSSRSQNLSFDFKEVNLIPSLADNNGPLNGHWEFLPDNRRAFILDDSLDIPMMHKDMLPHMANNQAPESDTRNTFNNSTTFPTTQNGVGQSNRKSSRDARRYGMASMPWSYNDAMMPPECFQSQSIHQPAILGGVMNHSNMMTALSSVTGEAPTNFQSQSVPQPNVLDSAFSTQLDSTRIPWPLPNAAIDLTSNHPEGIHHSGAYRATNHNEWNNLQQACDMDNYSIFSPHSNSQTQSSDGYPPTETCSQLASTHSRIPPLNTLESDINEIFFGSSSNANYVSWWDWQRHDPF